MRLVTIAAPAATPVDAAMSPAKATMLASVLELTFWPEPTSPRTLEMIEFVGSTSVEGGVSLALRLMLPVALTLEPLLVALTVSPRMLIVVEPAPARPPSGVTPPITTPAAYEPISGVERAERSMSPVELAVPAVTLESEIAVCTLFSTVFTDTDAPSAPNPPAVMEVAREAIVEASVAFRSMSPFDVTVEPSRIEASTVL